MSFIRLLTHIESIYDNLSLLINWSDDKNKLIVMVLNQANLIESFVNENKDKLSNNEVRHLLRHNSNSCLSLIEMIKED